ncbi:MAG TPA: hypothetical protein VG848_13330 [Acetobacteraceae bacterium]|jgi:hypothetical protein|nr:hypothetical protein [Acetobacteraceae bacterium]
MAMLNLSHEFDRVIGAAIARGVSPGPWRAEIERRFIAARFEGDEPECRKLLEECRERIAREEADHRSQAAAARRAAEDAACCAAARCLTARETVESVEKGGWHRLALRSDGAILIAGGLPADAVLRAAVEQHAEEIRTLLRAREEWSVLLPG